MTEPRPTRLVLTGSHAQLVELTDEQIAEHTARQAAHLQAEQDALAAREQLLDTVRSSTDPAVLALATLLGVIA